MIYYGILYLASTLSYVPTSMEYNEMNCLLYPSAHGRFLYLKLPHTKDVCLSKSEPVMLCVIFGGKPVSAGMQIVADRMCAHKIVAKVYM